MRTVVPHAARWDAIANDRAARTAALDSLGRVDLVRLAAEAIVDGVVDERLGTNAALRSELVESLATHFRVPLALHGHAILSIVRDGRNMSASHNANTIWDIEIAASVSASVTIRGTPSLLVTDDKYILQAANDLKVEGAFVALRTYRDRLKSQSFLS